MRLRRGRPPALSAAEVITGERLQALADVSVVPSHIRRFHRHLERFAPSTIDFEHYDELDDRALDRVAAARVIFVYSHELDPFLERVWPHLDGGPYVLISHNSDYGLDASRLPWVDAAGDRLRGWFAQNLEVRHPKLSPLPIGIANSMWRHGDVATLHRAMRRQVGRPREAALFAGFNPKTHPERAAVWQVLRERFELSDEPPKPRRFGSYLADLGRHRFCVCPRGNGADTHRLWECLYLGIVPVAQRSVHTELWEERGLPVLLVNAWEELTPELLGDTWGRLGPRASVESPPAELRLSHHAALIRGGA
jgi:hypothetical protein